MSAPKKCIFCDDLIGRDQQGRWFLTHPSAESPWQCTDNEAGHAPLSTEDGDDAGLTVEERKAIASLQRLARRWPQSLTLFSWSGSLVVFHSADMDRLVDVKTGALEKSDLVLDDIPGIPNSGGDP